MEGVGPDAEGQQWVGGNGGGAVRFSRRKAAFDPVLSVRLETGLIMMFKALILL